MRLSKELPPVQLSSGLQNAAPAAALAEDPNQQLLTESEKNPQLLPDPQPELGQYASYELAEPSLDWPTPAKLDPSGPVPDPPDLGSLKNGLAPAQAVPAGPPLSETQIRDTLATSMGANWNALSPAQQTRLSQTLLRLGVTEADLTQPKMQGMNPAMPMTQLLNALASSGRLSDQVLSGLEGLSSSELHPDLSSERLNLFHSALQDISFPNTIAQHNKGTCAATVPQIQLAIDNPAKYLQIMQALASPAGSVPSELVPPVQAPQARLDKIQSAYERACEIARERGLPEPPPPEIPPNTPEPLARDEGTTTDDGSGRSLTSRLMQPALMEYANGNSLSYDNATDHHSDSSQGLFQEQTTSLMNALGIPGNYTTEYGTGSELVTRIENSLSHGRPVPVSVKWDNLGSSNHEILVTQIDRSTNTVSFMNPWGQLNTMPLNEFEERLNSASIAQELPAEQRGAISALPPPANDSSNYHQLPWQDFRSIDQQLRFDPRYAQHLSQDQIQALGDFMRKNDVSKYYLDQLTPVIEAGGLDAAFFERLGNLPADPAAARTQFMNLAMLYQNLQEHPVEGKTLSETLAQLESLGLNLATPTVAMDLVRVMAEGELTPAFMSELAAADDPEAALTDKAWSIRQRQDEQKRRAIEELEHERENLHNQESRERISN